MQHPDRNHVREKWNKKHNERLAEMGDPLPNERLKYLSQSLAGGKALDLSCGLGGNCLFLAGHGYAVDAADISETAIKHVRELAEKRVLKLNASVMDLTDAENLPFKKGAYDLVVIAYYLDRALFPYVKCLLKEGGLFFLETYCDSPKLAGGKVSDKFRLKPNELLDEFRGWKVLFFEENELEGGKPFFAESPVYNKGMITYREDGWRWQKR